MRIVFVNMHHNALLLNPLSYIITRRPKGNKHYFFVKYLVENGIYFSIYVNGKSNSVLYRRVILKMGLNLSLKWLETISCYICLILNGINPLKVKIITNQEKLLHTDIVISYIHYTDTLCDLDKCNGRKLINMNHYPAGEGIKVNSALLADKKFDYFVYESNVAENSEFFKKYFGQYNIPMLLLPYAYSSRFQNLKKFSERKNMAMAVGTFSERYEGEFYEFFNTKCLHPMRKIIYDTKSELTEYIESYISPIHENHTETYKRYNQLNILKKFYYKYFVFTHQKQYYSFDMCEMFNEYKLCIVPEEIIGAPSIGFFEGMACGCACIGINSTIYTDLGLVPEKHYITYDGTLEGLINVVKHYQNHPTELEEIAQSGYNFALEHFNQKTVAENFYKKLLEISHSGN